MLGEEDGAGLARGRGNSNDYTLWDLGPITSLSRDLLR